MSARSLRCEAGFSLVEVLVALAVAGLIMTAASGLTWGVRRVEDRASRENAARENVIAADRVLRAVVNGAVPDVKRDRKEEVVGSRGRLTLTTSGPPIMAFDRPRPMTLFVDTVDGEARLLTRWRDPDTGSEREEVILKGARNLALSYFRSAVDNSAAAWQEVWSSPAQLPDAVLLRVDMPELGPPIDVIARTYSRLPYACTALPHEPRCNGGETAPQEPAE